MPYAGVRAIGVIQDQSPLNVVYDPGHPDADSDGNVSYPHVVPIMQTVYMIPAKTAYEANMSIFETTKQLLMRTLTIGR